MRVASSFRVETCSLPGKNEKTVRQLSFATDLSRAVAVPMIYYGIFIFCVIFRELEAREVLPPEAYINRTVYPALIDYAATELGFPELAIGVLSDVQYADRDEKQRRHFRLSLAKLEHAVNEFNVNRSHLDLVVHLGDLVDSDMAKWLPVLEPVLKRLKAPLYQVLGNHDFLGLPEAEFDTLHKRLGMPGKYYSINAGRGNKYRLIFLDGNDLALYSTREGSAERLAAEQMFKTLKSRRAKNAKPFNGGLGATQIAWLKQQLSEACESGQQAFIMLHHPVRPKDEPTNLWNDIAVVPIITGYHCAAAVINGHAHKLLYDFHHTKYRHVHFVTFGGMVQSPFTSFGFLDVYRDVLHVHGLVFGREIDLKLGMKYRAPEQSAPEKSLPTIASDGTLETRPLGFVATTLGGIAANDRGQLQLRPDALNSLSLAWLLMVFTSCFVAYRTLRKRGAI